MTLYTSVGILDFEYERPTACHPFVMVDGEKAQMDIPEMVVWTALCYRFLEPEQLEKLYDAEIVAFGLPNAPGCASTIERMLLRGLIAEGHGDSGHDALFDLICELRVLPMARGFISRLPMFLRLIFRYGVAPGRALCVLRPAKLHAGEKKVLALSGKVRMTVAEIIAAIDGSAQDIVSENTLLAALYADADTTSDNIRYSARLCEDERHSLVAVANLYLQKQIIFERS